MADLIKFQANVIDVHVRAKKLKWTDEAGDSYTETVRIGRMILEFNGDGADVAALAKFIHGKDVSIGLANTQASFLDD